MAYKVNGRLFYILWLDFSDKGVKVELGIPYDLWDKPSAEVSKMHRAVSTSLYCM